MRDRPVRDSVEGVLIEMRATVDSPPVGFTQRFWLDALMHRLVRLPSYEVTDAQDRAETGRTSRRY